jgi:hypothetical protein
MSAPDFQTLIDNFDRSGRMYMGVSIAVILFAAMSFLAALVGHSSLISEAVKFASPVFGTSSVFPFNSYMRCRNSRHTLEFVQQNYKKRRLSADERRRLDGYVEAILKGMIGNG